MTQAIQPAREIVSPGTHAVTNREITNRDAYLLANVIARGLDKDEMSAFVAVSRHTGLDPFRQQIYAWKDKGKLTVHIAVNGLRAMASRTGEYAGQDGPYWCGPDGQWRDVWLEDGPPAAAKVTVMRKGFAAPLTSVATLAEFFRPNSPNWQDRPAHMLAIRAEGHALKRAFPELFDKSFADLMPAGATVEVVGDDEIPQIAPPDVEQETAGARTLDQDTGEILDVEPDDPPPLPPSAELGAWFIDAHAEAEKAGVPWRDVFAALGCKNTADGVWRAANERGLDLDGLIALARSKR